MSLPGNHPEVGRRVRRVAGGMGLDDVAKEYGITAEDVKAALNYAAQLIAK